MTSLEFSETFARTVRPLAFEADREIEARWNYESKSMQITDPHAWHMSVLLCACIVFSADLLQALSVLTMERPVSFSAEDIRDEKVRAICEWLMAFFVSSDAD